MISTSIMDTHITNVLLFAKRHHHLLHLCIRLDSKLHLIVNLSEKKRFLVHRFVSKQERKREISSNHKYTYTISDSDRQCIAAVLRHTLLRFNDVGRLIELFQISTNCVKIKGESAIDL